MLQMIKTDLDGSRGGHYSHAVRAGDFIYVAGQTPRDSQRNILGTTIEDQTVATMENVRLILSNAGATLEQVVKVSVHLSNLADQSRFNAVYQQYFPTFQPVRTTVGSTLNNILVEIDVVAYVGAPSTAGHQ